MDSNPLKAYYADQEGQIGTSAAHPIDNPFDNIFHVAIADELCGNEEAWLTYELEGVADHTAISRSINDQIAFGGYLVKQHQGWVKQREKVSVNWLREGDNIIRFSVPGGAKYSYKVRNLSIELKVTNDQRPLVLNQPTLNYFNDKAYVKGFISENGKLTIDGQPVQTFNGEFEKILNKPDNINEVEWSAQVEVTYGDGTSVCERVVFVKSVEADYSYEMATASWKKEQFFTTESAQQLQVRGASIEVPAGGLSRAAHLSITTLREVDIPALDAGMVNVTGSQSGYRFLPHGTAFEKESRVVVPYDSAKIPSGYTANDIKTYFFDEQGHHWMPLPLDSVLSESGLIWSKTTHFTDMINGIIQVPESPEVNAYNSTSMKGIKAANPTAAINLMQPPSANSMGNANMSYPLNLPAGRNGMQPQLALSYTNGGGNSWLGLGWNMSIPSVTIDTRWGVPRYSTEQETETYSLNGQQLSPVAHRGKPENRESEKRFYPRVEGSFQRIIRHENSPEDYWWEVTDKSGTRYLYGGIHKGSPGEGNLDPASVLRTDEAGNKGNIAQWNLTEVIDLNGNFVRYESGRFRVRRW